MAKKYAVRETYQNVSGAYEVYNHEFDTLCDAIKHLDYCKANIKISLNFPEVAEERVIDKNTFMVFNGSENCTCRLIEK